MMTRYTLKRNHNEKQQPTAIYLAASTAVTFAMRENTSAQSDSRIRQICV